MTTAGGGTMDAGAAIASGRMLTLDPLVTARLLGADVPELATAAVALAEGFGLKVASGLWVGTGPLAGAPLFVGNGVAVGAGATLGATVELVDPPAEAVGAELSGGAELAGGADTGKSGGTTPFWSAMATAARLLYDASAPRPFAAVSGR